MKLITEKSLEKKSIKELEVFYKELADEIENLSDIKELVEDTIHDKKYYWLEISYLTTY